jgi:hypothetical protein
VRWCRSDVLLQPCIGSVARPHLAIICTFWRLLENDVLQHAVARTGTDATFVLQSSPRQALARLVRVVESPMRSLTWNAESPRPAVRSEPPAQRPSTPALGAPTLNTILAVREHAPAEIEELETEIQTLHYKLGAAYARKRLLEQLLEVIRESDADRTRLQSGMSVLK